MAESKNTVVENRKKSSNYTLYRYTMNRTYIYI